MNSIQRQSHVSILQSQAYNWAKERSSSIQTPYGAWFQAENTIINQPFQINACKETPFKVGGKVVRKGTGPVAVTIKLLDSAKNKNNDFFNPLTVVFLRSRAEDPAFSLKIFANEFLLQLSKDSLNSKFDELPLYKQVRIYNHIKDTLLPKVVSELNKRFPEHQLSEVDYCRALAIGRSS